MTSRPPALIRFAGELRRRRVFTTAGLYVVGAWLVMQVADILFPGWGLPDAAVNVLFIAAVVGFPLALDRLEQAVKSGWRGYYVNNHDPRWSSLRNAPRYQALMAEVKADVDRQRAELERIDAEEDFQALLDKVLENKKSTAGENSGES